MLDTCGHTIKGFRFLCNLKYIFVTAFGKAFGLNLNWKSDMDNARRFYQFMFIWRGNPSPNAYIGCCHICRED